jgi:hypothetical protein
MLISSYLLQNSYKNYQRVKENFTTGQAIEAGTSAAFVSFSLVVSIIFFILELLLLFYGIKIAIYCSEPGPERIVNLVLVTMFTMPYMLLNILFNKCAKTCLQS